MQAANKLKVHGFPFPKPVLEPAIYVIERSKGQVLHVELCANRVIKLRVHFRYESSTNTPQLHSSYHHFSIREIVQGKPIETLKCVEYFVVVVRPMVDALICVLQEFTCSRHFLPDHQPSSQNEPDLLNELCLTFSLLSGFRGSLLRDGESYCNSQGKQCAEGLDPRCSALVILKPDNDIHHFQRISLIGMRMIVELSIPLQSQGGER